MTTRTRRPITVAVSDHWRDYAVCQTVDPELFFPDGPGGATKAKAEQAKRVCQGCPVRSECLDWAFETGQQFGVLGGLTQEERWQLTKVAPRSAGTAMDRCVESREQILAWRKAGVAQRVMASRLNVDRTVVSAAIRRFDRDTAAAQEVAA
ncbi:WhiB family transcriptional regulator [Streptomyces sp. NPDC006551]|uniref:WhiB family transcriptional regulator n=1 Tax=Streptomyces sp. NPDC006551 TaxID=3157178 RepID=UPI0033B7FB55